MSMTSAITASITDNGTILAPTGGAGNRGWKLGYINLGFKGSAACNVTIGDVAEVKCALLSSDGATARIIDNISGTAVTGGKVMDYASDYVDNTFILHQGTGTSSGVIVYK